MIVFAPILPLFIVPFYHSPSRRDWEKENTNKTKSEYLVKDSAVSQPKFDSNALNPLRDVEIKANARFPNVLAAQKKEAEMAELKRNEDLYDSGISCIEGNGVIKNPEKGAQYLLSAAERGHVKSESAIGYCYITGCGVSQNIEEAEKWLKLAASSGDITAKKNLEIINDIKHKRFLSNIKLFAVIFFVSLLGVAIKPWHKIFFKKNP